MAVIRLGAKVAFIKIINSTRHLPPFSVTIDDDTAFKFKPTIPISEIGFSGQLEHSGLVRGKVENASNGNRRISFVV